jgi:peptide-methionine (S)-S-oxide reductase
MFNIADGAKSAAIAALIALAPFGAALSAGQAAEPVFTIPAPETDLTQSGSSAVAVLAGGCFWGVQAVYQHTKGVINAVSGYSGGEANTAQYLTVATGRTGHAESVEITYDPSVISYGELLHIYFSVAHNPTELNKQGPDHGTQYRSTIFVSSDAQRQVAAAYIAQLEAANIYPGPIVTTIEPLNGFYPAEQEHQDYLVLHPNALYIVYNDLPKIGALQAIFADEFRSRPVLVGMLK